MGTEQLGVNELLEKLGTAMKQDGAVQEGCRTDVRLQVDPMYIRSQEYYRREPEKVLKVKAVSVGFAERKLLDLSDKCLGFECLFKAITGSPHQVEGNDMCGLSLHFGEMRREIGLVMHALDVGQFDGDDKKL